MKNMSFGAVRISGQKTVGVWLVVSARRGIVHDAKIFRDYRRAMSFYIRRDQALTDYDSIEIFSRRVFVPIIEKR